jgi:hypothetical protein
MTSQTVATLYRFARVDIPPLTAWVALEQTARSVGTQFPLRLDPSPTWSGRSCPWVIGEWNAWLRVGWHKEVPVEITISAWSTKSSELGIRPRNGSVPIRVSRGRDRYQTASSAAVRELAKLLTESLFSSLAADLERTRSEQPMECEAFRADSRGASAVAHGGSHRSHVGLAPFPDTW